MARFVEVDAADETPDGWVARGATAVSLASVRLSVGEVRPAQPPAILGPIGFDHRAPELASPDPAVYAGNVPYPQKLASFRGHGRFAGQPEVGVCVGEFRRRGKLESHRHA